MTGDMTPGASATTAHDSHAGCTAIWQHTITRASLGICGREPARHEVTTTCPRCHTTGNQRICQYCWGSFATTGLCGTCLEPLQITERTRGDA